MEKNLQTHELQKKIEKRRDFNTESVGKNLSPMKRVVIVRHDRIRSKQYRRREIRINENL